MKVVVTKQKRIPAAMNTKMAKVVDLEAAASKLADNLPRQQ